MCLLVHFTNSTHVKNTNFSTLHGDTDQKRGYTENLTLLTGFLGSSAGKESACDAGNLGSIPGSGRSPREGIGYPLQYSWASLVA